MYRVVVPLTNAYVQIYGKLPEVFNQIAQAQAPDKFTVQYLKDLGFTSANFRAVIPLMKALGFLSEDGTPTSRYHEYRNTALSRRVMASALRGAYGDLFTIRAAPTAADRRLLEGKFKSVHNVSPNAAKLMASTFFSLLEMTDLDAADENKRVTEEDEELGETSQNKPIDPAPIPPLAPPALHRSPTLHYNIQIHLPATKDIEVFNAIFKSLRAHLIE